MLLTILTVLIRLTLGIYITELIHKHIWKDHSVIWTALCWILGQFLFWTAHYASKLIDRFDDRENAHKIFYWLACYYQYGMRKNYDIDQKYKFNWWKD
jgi:hypothetical protein